MAATLKDEIGKRGRFSGPEQEAYLNLLRTAATLSPDFEGLFGAHGLSEATYNVLRILRGATLGPKAPGKKTCSQVGEHLVAQGPDVTRLLDRLERAGLVARERCKEDRRVVYASITRAGLALLAKLDAPTVELHRAQLGHMTRAELAKLSRLLVKARTHPPSG